MGVGAEDIALAMTGMLRVVAGKVGTGGIVGNDDLRRIPS
jgi:hypothetical protein